MGISKLISQFMDLFFMDFSKALIGITFTAILLSACGGGSDTEAPSTPETTAEIATPQAETTETITPAVTPAQPAAQTAEAELSVEFAGLPSPYAEADYARGRRVFRQCSSCHTIAEGASNLVGPNLYGLFSRKIGTAPDFPYSNAVLEADFQWTPEQLSNWLANPRAFLPGNRMSFAGVRRETDRTAVIAYVMLESGWTAPEE